MAPQSLCQTLQLISQHFHSFQAKKKGWDFLSAALSGSHVYPVELCLMQPLGRAKVKQDLLRQMLTTFEPGDIVLGDAYFGSYFFLAWLIEHKVDAVFEQMGARKTDFTQGQLLGVKDHIVKLQKPKRKPAWMPQKGVSTL